MKQTVTRAIVLSRINYGEADRILTMFTPDQGKIRAIAKGVRKTTSKLAGGIELFGINHITFITGKSELYTLISSRLDKHFGNIVSDINRTMFGYDALKIVNKMTEDAAGEEYFDLLACTLSGLNNKDLDLELVRLWFYVRLLMLGGHVPNLTKDNRGEKLAENETYGFNFDDMAFQKSGHGNFKSSHIKLLRLSEQVNSPEKLGNVSGLEPVIADCVQLAKTLLSSYVRL